MQGLCENCKHINKKKIYHNIFDDKIWYGCKKLAQGTTKDDYYLNGELHWNDTNPRCYEENPQYKMEIKGEENK